ncbi:cell surface protein [Lachnospiraceae bacterium KM106-2]|nr:cell surface protein [Lachnospiraceae bacterium KM106-2]
MKRTKRLAIAMVTALTLAVATPCVVPDMGVTVSAASKVKLNKKKVTIVKGKKYKLKLQHAKAAKVKWSTKNKKVATVSKKGVVTAKKKGSTNIIAKYGKKKYTCKVTVKNPKKTPTPVTPAPTVDTTAPVTPSTVTPAATPVEVRTAVPTVFNGTTVADFHISKEASVTGGYRYSYYGTVNNTSPYTLSGIAVHITGYAANGTVVEGDEYGYTTGSFAAGQAVGFNEFFYSNYDIAYFTITKVTPSFANNDEQLNVSGVTLPAINSQIGSNIYLTAASMTATHNIGTFDTIDANFEFTAKCATNEWIDVVYTLNAYDAAGNVISTHTYDNGYFARSVTENQVKIYWDDMPCNVARIGITAAVK